MKNHDADIEKLKTSDGKIALHESFLKEIIEAQNSLREDLIKEDVVSIL